MSSEITIDEFMKVDLRVGLVKEAEVITGTKLVRLLVDLGELGERQIIAGIGEYYKPEDLIGRRIIVVANLKPKKIRGYVSQGMLLAAEDRSGRPYILTVDGEPEPGAKIV
ncbi:MAG TPA: methionine--tRNA ligase subunit beta [Desulfurococcales archaeon]|nr:methionine--tRNA ligase subunit beta [Desulfurococcales archaeon]